LRITFYKFQETGSGHVARNVSERRSDPPKLSARWDQSRGIAGIGPQVGFAGAIFAGFAAWAASSAMLPPDAVMPLVSTLFLILAGAFAVVAWRRRLMDPRTVTYLDVAGALTLIGLCAAATIDADQMIRLVQSGPATD